MKLEMMAIYDSASAAYLPPFVVATVAMMQRQLQEQAERDANHSFVKYSEQFVVFHLGAFDNETGLVTSMPPTSLGTIQSLLARSGK